MPQHEPASVEVVIREGATPTPWTEVTDRLRQVGFVTLSTVRPDGRPHATPVLAIWADGALNFASNPTARKARNLVTNPACVVSFSHSGLDIVLEGRAARVTDDAGLRQIADATDWPVEVGEDEFSDAEFWAPTSAGPPFHVFRIVPETVFAMPSDGVMTPTRYRF